VHDGHANLRLHRPQQRGAQQRSLRPWGRVSRCITQPKRTQPRVRRPSLRTAKLSRKAKKAPNQKSARPSRMHAVLTNMAGCVRGSNCARNRTTSARQASRAHVCNRGSQQQQRKPRLVVLEVRVHALLQRMVKLALRQVLLVRHGRRLARRQRHVADAVLGQHAAAVALARADSLSHSLSPAITRQGF
jgi:hypothetical protein